MIYMTKDYNVPSVIERNGGSERAYDIYARLLMDRIVFVTGEINDELANAVCAQLLYLQAMDGKAPVHMYVNSPGGVVTSGLGILDTMKFVSCPVYTYCFGQAASMAAVILAAGCRGHRYSLPNSRIMIHQPSGGMEGKASDVEISYREMQFLKDALNAMLAKFAKRKVSVVEKATDRDNFMSAEEAVGFGLIDEVITKAPAK